MGWAINHIKKLQTGETIQFKPRGNSMKGKIDSGNRVTVMKPFKVFSLPGAFEVIHNDPNGVWHFVLLALGKISVQ